MIVEVGQIDAAANARIIDGGGRSQWSVDGSVTSKLESARGCI